jgi:hypothetical protein
MFLGFGILGGYLWINLEQTRKRPLFIVDREIGGPGPESRPPAAKGPRRRLSGLRIVKAASPPPGRAKVGP